jgi:hypothetical protein
MFQRFLSICRPEIGYSLETGRFETAFGRPIARWAFEYKTFGDGLTVHCHPYAVQVENIQDFLVSLAGFLLEPRNEEEHDTLFDGLITNWPRKTDRALLAFAHSVRYEENKRRFYSRTDRKISAAESKRHDRRWEQIPSWADGSIVSMARVLSGDVGLAVIPSYRLYRDCHEYLREDPDRPWGGRRPEEILVIDRDVEYGFDAVSELLDAWEGLARASRIVKNYSKKKAGVDGGDAGAEKEAAG